MWLFKNRHGRWQERLSAYLDAQLEPSEQRKLERQRACFSWWSPWGT